LPLLELDRLRPARHDPRLTPELVIRALEPVLSPKRRRRIDRVLRRRLISVTVVLENLHDPHNGAAALRTCEALGLHHVHVVAAREPFSFSRKVSQHAHKWLAVYLHRSTEACLGYLERAGFCCWAAVPPPLDASPAERLAVEVDRPLALVFGNEHEGLSDVARALCPESFAVPMYGFTESLNLSVSVAVTLSQVTRDRRRALSRQGDLPPRALTRLRAACYAQSTRYAAQLVHAAI
jgi:tRNA (guanosine-2'-O-)-methyltransferase